jgi:transcriptional regulator with PAS, ATPase and Fis domain
MPGHVILQNKETAGVYEEAMAILLEYNYPGNVRKLENIIEHAFVLCSSGLIKTRHPPPQFRGKGNIDTLKVKRDGTLKALEAIHIADTVHIFMMLTAELRPGNSASIPASFFARSSHWG